MCPQADVHVLPCILVCMLWKYNVYAHLTVSFIPTVNLHWVLQALERKLLSALTIAESWVNACIFRRPSVLVLSLVESDARRAVRCTVHVLTCICNAVLKRRSIHTLPRMQAELGYWLPCRGVYKYLVSYCMSGWKKLPWSTIPMFMSLELVQLGC